VITKLNTAASRNGLGHINTIGVEFERMGWPVRSSMKLPGVARFNFSSFLCLSSKSSYSGPSVECEYNKDARAEQGGILQDVYHGVSDRALSFVGSGHEDRYGMEWHIMRACGGQCVTR
jgi:hypothetical protein